MPRFREYRFELCWLAILIVVVLLTPGRSSAAGFSWIDMALDCDSSGGWCISHNERSVQ